MNRISTEEMRYTSRLAALYLTDEELEAAKETVEGLLENFAVLENVKVEGIEPAVHLFPVCGELRGDVVTEKPQGVQEFIVPDTRR